MDGRDSAGLVREAETESRRPAPTCAAGRRPVGVMPGMAVRSGGASHRFFFSIITLTKQNGTRRFWALEQAHDRPTQKPDLPRRNQGPRLA
jgi:hypothetical protein